MKTESLSIEQTYNVIETQLGADCIFLDDIAMVNNSKHGGESMWFMYLTIAVLNAVN